MTLSEGAELGCPRLDVAMAAAARTVAKRAFGEVMSVEVEAAELLPIAPYVGRSAAGEPRFEGSRCAECDAVYLGTRTVCGRCASRDRMEAVILASTGRLYNYTVVYRSHPGVETPFISVIVDLDGGGDVRGNLVGVAPEDIRFDMPVRAVFERARQTDAKGRAYLSYYFVPA
jgi:uncharacterized OB-fold protein